MTTGVNTSRRHTRGPLSGPARVWLMTTAIAGVAAVIWAAFVHGTNIAAGNLKLPFWALAAAFALAEVMVVHLEFGGEAHTLSMNEVVLVIGFVSIAPSQLVLAEVVGIAAALLIVRKQRPVKLAFNLAQYALGTILALVVFHAIGGRGDATSAVAWVAAPAGAAAAGAVGVVLVSFAILASGGGFERRDVAKSVAFAACGSLANTCVGILAVIVMTVQPAATVFLAFPIVLMLLAYRAWSRERAQRTTVDFLYDSMRTLQQVADTDGVVAHLLEASRTMFRADFAEILLPPTNEREGLRGVRDGEVLTIEPGVQDTAAEHGAAILAGHLGAQIVHGDGQPGTIGQLMREKGLADAMIGVLRGGDESVGLLIVGNRIGEVASFSRADLGPFEAFAGHVAVALERDHLERTLRELSVLKDELHHQASHDPLTGLANRSLFADRIQQAFERPAGGASTVAVLYLDLDDFKSVNDTMGHAVGDRLLALVAERVRRCIRAGDLAARLGGDEFAVLMESSSRQTAQLDADETAARVTRALETPFELESQLISIGASIGVAVDDGTERDPDGLMRRADASMYEVKRGAGRPA